MNTAFVFFPLFPSCSLYHNPLSHFPRLFLTLRYDHSFELYSESERLYLFGTDEPDSHKEWVKSIAKVTTKYTLRSRNTTSASFSSGGA